MVRHCLAVLLASVAMLASPLLCCAPAEAGDKAPATIKVIIAGTLLGSTRVVGDIASISGGYKDVETEFGTKVELTAVASGPTATAALVSGSADFGIFSTVEVMRAAVIGQPILGLMGMSTGGDVLFVTSKKNADVGDGLAALKKFDGKRWGVVSVGGIGAAFGGLAADSAGIDWKSQTVIPGGSDSALVGSLLNDRLDMIILNIPTAATLFSKGEGHVVFDTNSPEAVAKWGEVIGGTFAANADFAKKYPEATAAMVRAELKALLKAKELKDDAKAVYAMYPEDYRQALGFDAFSIGWMLYVPTFENLSGIITDKDIASTTAVLRKIGRLKDDEQVPASTFNSDYVREAYKSLGVPVPQ